MLDLAKEIIEEFEKREIVIFSTSDFEEYTKEVMLYLSAKEYVYKYR